MTNGRIAQIERFLLIHGGHWMFAGRSVGGPYVGCNNCCQVTNPSDWPMNEAASPDGPAASDAGAPELDASLPSQERIYRISRQFGKHLNAACECLSDTCRSCETGETLVARLRAVDELVAAAKDLVGWEYANSGGDPRTQAVFDALDNLVDR